MEIKLKLVKLYSWEDPDLKDPTEGFELEGPGHPDSYNPGGIMVDAIQLTFTLAIGLYELGVDIVENVVDFFTGNEE